MDRVKFKEMFENPDQKVLTVGEYNDILQKSMDRCGWTTKTMIIMEELAELSQEVSKACRDEDYDKIGLIEELADVSICINMLMKKYGISKADIQLGMNVKMQREKERCE